MEDATATPISFFHISITGEIDSVEFPLGPDGSEIFCRYEVIAGPDWELITGLDTGITQCSVVESGDRKIVFNMPIDFSYKSTNPYGWPQILLMIYGKNFWGSVNSLGYARIHVPIFGLNQTRFVAPILIPKCPDILSDIVNWITGRNPELKDPKILLDGTKNGGLDVDCYGKIILNLQAICRGTGSMGYDWPT